MHVVKPCLLAAAVSPHTGKIIQNILKKHILSSMPYRQESRWKVCTSENQAFLKGFGRIMLRLMLTLFANNKGMLNPNLFTVFNNLYYFLR